MIWIIVFVLFILFIVWGQQSLNKNVTAVENEFQKILNAKGIDQSTKVMLGTYVGGHPDLDNMIIHVFSFKHQNCLALYAKLYKTRDLQSLYFDHIADIPIDKIKDISIEDTSSIEKKITLGTILLVGVFALAWKKKNEEAFLNIKWTDGKYEHETLFQFESKGAFQEANRTRNSLIKQTK